MSSGGADTQTQRDIDAEIAELSATISRNPRDAKSYRRRGLLKARSRRYDEALQDFERTLKLAPDDGHAYGLRALVWAKKGDRERALRDFDDAIRLAPPDYAALFRSHRERVLTENSEGPIAGGDFNILTNPFVLLGLSPTAKPAAIKEAYEDAVEDGVEDADLLRRAQQTLLTPRLRIEAEVGGFLDVDPGLAAQIVSDIRSGTPIGEIGERLTKLHSLPRSNVIAHYGSARSAGLSPGAARRAHARRPRRRGKDRPAASGGSVVVPRAGGRFAARGVKRRLFCGSLPPDGQISDFLSSPA
jgi:tetratricopeptide (TPR) repeat protein